MKYKEIFSDPLDFPTNKMHVNDGELPSVTNELSVTLRLNVKSHNSGWQSIFHKGVNDKTRTPSIWLSPNTSEPRVRFSTNDNFNCGLTIPIGLELNKWYHIGYTLSETLKRMDFYLNGKWVGFKSIEFVQTQYVMFNKDPLHIGCSTDN
ncbi:17075_t:CDS:2 [Acaulospora morrowiae]|uniref:17075_t:CDS:1 n=1 Tax=Acaulospora morrowiae TaxID=94023 RepID=A0A9N9HAL6_9GLOM|nr:17075_t:CDS:2 [Acaulospora morrowiae]